jgi:hypothetical protein
MPAQDPYAQFGPPVQPPTQAQADPYAAFGPPVAPPKAAAPLPNAGLAPAAGAPPKTLDSGEGPIAQGMTSLENRLVDMARPEAPAGAGMGTYGSAVTLAHPEMAAQPDARGPMALSPIATDQGSLPRNIGTTIANLLPMAIDPGLEGVTESPAAHTLSGIKNIAQDNFGPPKANLVKGTYSEPGNQLAASLRGSTRFDVPAAAADAHPAISEGLADRGITTADFKGRNGPAALQAGIDNALDIQEARAKSVIDPIRGEKVDPQILAQNPELAARFPGKQDITYGGLDAERIKMNKELRRANFYSKDPSTQYAVADPLANTEAAVNQARDLVYGKAQDVTGYDLRPLKQTESNLIKLGDLAETTKNGLSLNAAQNETAPPLAKGVNAIKKIVSIKKNPASSLASLANSSGTLDLGGFNSNMRRAFADVNPATADRTVALPKFNLNLTPPPPGEVGPTPMQNILNFSQEAHPEPNPTRLPESSIRQKLLSAPTTAQSDVPRSLGAAAAVPDTANIPDKLRGMLTEMNDPQLIDAARAQRGRATELPGKYPAQQISPVRDPFAAPPASAPKLQANGEITWPDSYKNPPQGGGGNYTASDLDILKKRMGIDTAPQGGHAGGSVASVEELARPGKNYVVKPDGSLTFHGKAFAPEETPKGSAHVTVLPDGTFRVNEGNLTPAMRKALERGIKQ